MTTEKIWTEQELLDKIAALESAAEQDNRMLNEAFATAQDHGVEILKLRARVGKLEDAIRVSLDFDFGEGYAWWDSYGNPKIGSLGYKLLKETLENT